MTTQPSFDIHTQRTWTENATGRTWRRNGATKTWKTRPGEFRIPVKFGLYAYGYITDHNHTDFTADVVI